MDKTSVVGLTAITGFVAGGVWLSALLDNSPEPTEPVAAAIKADFSEYIPYLKDPARRAEAGIDKAAICIQTEERLDYPILAERLADSFLHPIPASDCTSKTVEGDFGMFTALTYWFDKDGAEAGKIDIVAVRCPTPSRCFVDIDHRGGGNRYEAIRSGGRWVARWHKMRWVV
ncbi:hypothetical protein [Erythrobacter sp.]|jgi:hypothetical protein|uniref:hypothetical protein n=1 Tax=Erythrobacter sp. TaxID=1042 RepID=UPI002EAA841A|nr:hypothetical protein [Erythrobacter sp.]